MSRPLARVVGLGLLATVLSAMTLVASVTSSRTDGSTRLLTAAEGATASGRALFQAKGCSSCHSRAGTSNGGVGPDLTYLAMVAASRKPGVSAEAYVRESIVEPQAFVVRGYSGVGMPRLPLNDREVEALVGFLLDEGPGGRTSRSGR